MCFTNAPPVPSDWTLIVGDALNNYRCTLDYIAWQLVYLGTEPKPLPEGKASQVAFPIVSDRTRFRPAVERKLPGVDDMYVRMVERRQPFRYPQPAEHPLALLAHYSNADKHRALHILGTQASAADVRLGTPKNCEVLQLVPVNPAPCSDGDEFAWIFVAPDGQGEPELPVQIRTHAVVRFAEGPLLATTLRAIDAIVSEVLAEFRVLI